MTTEEIRKDLKTIRGYYAERQALESEFLLLPHKTTKLVQAYADWRLRTDVRALHGLH